uniref:GPR158/179 extracellular domain-containing protein n=1 Tax=Jaculus jaculus TaxID=51337 RepID=A0A8C5NUZ7_JACJA
MGSRAVVMPSPAWALLASCFLCGWALGGPRPLRSLPVMASQAKPGPGPTWAPPQGAEAALAFLYSGDAQRLLGANCSKRYEAHGAEGRPGLPAVLQRAAGTLAQAANFLNMLLQANDIRESSVEEDVEWYQALVRSVAEGDPRAYRALLTFNPPPGASHLQLALQATRMGEETILQDLSGNRVQEGSPPEDPDSPTLQKRVLTNDLRSLDSPKWPRGDGYVGDIQQVRLSPPFLECQDGRLRPGWLVTLSATFYGLKPDLSPEVRGQVQMDIDLQNVDINQCASSPGWYSNTHLCDLNSTQVRISFGPAEHRLPRLLLPLPPSSSQEQLTKTLQPLWISDEPLVTGRDETTGFCKVKSTQCLSPHPRKLSPCASLPALLAGA